MMSKEREFLKKLRCASLLENDLRKEIEELLAQPEHIPDVGNMVKPVAWFYDYDGTTWVKLKEPDLPNMHHSVTNIRPLYLTPQREPLSYKPIQDYLKSYNQEISYDYEQGFEDGVEWAEHQHGIGVNYE